MALKELIQVVNKYTAEELEEENQLTLMEMKLYGTTPNKIDAEKIYNMQLAKSERNNRKKRERNNRKKLDKKKCNNSMLLNYKEYPEAYRFSRSLKFNTVFECIKSFESLEEFTNEFKNYKKIAENGSENKETA